jgi:hypothetical protein
MCTPNKCQIDSMPQTGAICGISAGGEWEPTPRAPQCFYDEALAQDVFPGTVLNKQGVDATALVAANLAYPDGSSVPNPLFCGDIADG